jgi:hypothetical protein
MPTTEDDVRDMAAQEKHDRGACYEPDCWWCGRSLSERHAEAVIDYERRGSKGDTELLHELAEEIDSLAQLVEDQQYTIAEQAKLLAGIEKEREVGAQGELL